MCAWLFHIATTQGQALKTGDAMPDYKFPSVLQWKRGDLTLQELRGKVVIMDFWSTFCGACIDLMPHMQELQDHFKDKVQIILVNGWDKDSVKVIRTVHNLKRSHGANIRLPVGICDKEMMDYFPHRAEPFEVIIDSKGKVLKMTSAENMTKENIQAILNGKGEDIPGIGVEWNRNVPVLLHLDSDQINDVVVNSTLMKQTNENLICGPKYNKNGDIIGVLISFTAIEGYIRAFNNLFKGEPLIRCESKSEIFGGRNGLNARRFVYDLTLPAGRYSEDYFKFCLGQDLEKAFNFTLERKLVDSLCVIIRSNAKISNHLSKRSIEDTNIDYIQTAVQKHLPVYAYGVNVFRLVSSMKGYWPDRFGKIIDQTDDIGLVDLDFPVDFDFTNFDSVKRFLSDKGIELLIEKKNVPVVVISDRHSGEPVIKGDVK